MPGYREHVVLASHNRECAKDVRTAFGTKFNDWIVTVRFYESVHLVEAMIASSGGALRAPVDNVRYPEKRTLVNVKASHSADLAGSYGKNGHELRDCLIRDNASFFGDVGNACRFLRKLSRSARYDCQKILDEESALADDKLFQAEKAFNGRAINLRLEMVG